MDGNIHKDILRFCYRGSSLVVCSPCSPCPYSMDKLGPGANEALLRVWLTVTTANGNEDGNEDRYGAVTITRDNEDSLRSGNINAPIR